LGFSKTSNAETETKLQNFAKDTTHLNRTFAKDTTHLNRTPYKRILQNCPITLVKKEQREATVKSVGYDGQTWTRAN